MTKDVKKPQIILRSAFSYDHDAVSMANGLSCPESTLTQQNTAEQTDINYIVAQFTRTGILPQAKQLPTYGDFTGVSDYRQALDLIRESDNMFQNLPSEARKHFNNSPADFLDYMLNEPQQALIDKLGLSDYVDTPQTSPSGETSTVTST